VARALDLLSRLHLPASVIVRIKSRGEVCHIADVLIGVRAFAQNKNDYSLGPYATNADGLAHITRNDLQAEVEAAHDSGLMDHAGIAQCNPIVQLFVWSAEDIRKALGARHNVWPFLLRGERDRWGSMAELLALYDRALVVAEKKLAGFVAPVDSNWCQPDQIHDLDLDITPAAV
jgi:hypothetical protein